MGAFSVDNFIDMNSTLLNSSPDVRSEIANNSDLLALPESVIQVLESVGKDDISFVRLADIISRDPALTGRLLKIANSPFYGLSHRVNSINQAVMILGITTVKCLTLSAAIFGRRGFPDKCNLDINSLYGSFISVAMTCRKVAVACRIDAPEDAFAAGLLLDIGLLYFINQYPEKYNRVLQDARMTGRLIEQEMKHFGISHPEAGGLLASKWGLPKNIVEAISHHHEDSRQDNNKLGAIVRLAVVLNRNVLLEDDVAMEEKINLLTSIAKRLGLSTEQLTEIAAATIRDAMAFAHSIDVEIEDYETILTRANKEIFNTYLSLQTLFRERQELNDRILKEERSKGILEAKRIATSTLSHYINNAAMEISGHSQLIRMATGKKSGEELKGLLPRELDIIDQAVKKVVAVLQEITELNMLDEMEFFEKSKILNIDKKIKERIAALSRY